MNIKQIAKLSGFSTATVSRVLNGKSGVKKETKDKIEKIMKEYDYVPNIIARNLSNQSSNFIAVIIPDITNSFFADIIRGISSIINQSGFSMVLFDTNEEIELEHQYLNDLYELNVSALIITPVSENDEISRNLINRLSKRGIKIVQVDRQVSIDDLDGIFIENKRGAELAISEFIRNGHEKIAVITGPEYSKPGRERLEGYLTSLRRHDIEIRDDYIKYGDFKSISGYQHTKELLESIDPPTAILCINNMMTLGALRYLHEHHYQIGKNISLIGFDDIEILDWFDVNLTVIKRPTTLMGVRAAELMIEKLEEEKDQSYQIILPVELIVRGSEKYIF